MSRTCSSCQLSLRSGKFGVLRLLLGRLDARARRHVHLEAAVPLRRRRARGERDADELDPASTAASVSALTGAEAAGVFRVFAMVQTGKTVSLRARFCSPYLFLGPFSIKNKNIKK